MSARQPSAFEELTALDQWVDWRYEWVEGHWTKAKVPKWVEGHWTKVPYSAVTGNKASTTDPRTWATYDQAEQYWAATRDAGDAALDGIGFVFKRGGNLTGIDLDHCRDAESGVIAPWAIDIIESMDSYAELSPSKTGVHIFVHGSLPLGGRKMTRPDGGGIEMYDWGRYFTVTWEAL